MDDQKIDLILDRLVEQTESGKLNWKTTSDKDTYLLALRDSSISLARIHSAGFICRFRNSNGDVIEEVVVVNGLSRFQKLKKLFDTINGTDRTIDSILEQLAA